MERDNQPKLHDGNTFFEHKYPSIDIERAIENLYSFEQFDQFFSDDLMNENLLLAKYLDHLIDKYHSNPNAVSEEIGASHDYVRQIVLGKKSNPDRDYLLATCVFLGATVEETQVLMRYSGKPPLYARRRRDAIIWFALKKHQKLYDLDAYLHEKGFATLGKFKDTQKEDERTKKNK